MLKIYFDNNLQDIRDFDGTESISFVYRRKNEQGESGNGFSPELTLVGAAFQYVYAAILAQPLPALAEIKVRVEDDCCTGFVFVGKIRGSDVSWCEIPNCEAKVTIIDDSEDSIFLACLKNTLIWDRIAGVSPIGEDTFRTARFLYYCNDPKPSFLTEMVFILYTIIKIGLLPLAAIIGLLITVVNIIISLVGAPPLGGDINFFDDVFEFITLADSLITGCGFKHKAPFIHSYLQNVCNICGLGLSSSLFQTGGAYHNTVRLDANFKPGRKLTARILNAYEENKPNLNGIQFLETFKQFNIDWKVSGGVLYVERKDFFNGGLWFDASLLDPKDITLCFEEQEELPPAFAEYDYPKDGVDNAGDEVAPDWSDTVIDWNIPVNPAQIGLKSVKFQFGAAQFRNDANRDDVPPIDKPIYNVLFPILLDNRDGMIIEKGVMNFPKLLQWDGVSPQDNAKIRRFSSTQSGLFDYNVDWWVSLSYTDGGGVGRDTAYQRLFFIDDPRYSGIKRRKFNLNVNANCVLLAGLSLDKIVRIPQGGNVYDGEIEEIEYNYTENTFNISGKI